MYAFCYLSFMRIFFAFIFFFGIQLGFTQNIQIARSYYEQGKFEKALISFESIYKRNPTNSQAVVGLAKCYRQLNKSNDAVEILKKSQRDNPEQLIYLVELGVTYNLNKQTEKAEETFDTLVLLLQEKPNNGSYIGNALQQYNLLKPAITCYKIAMEYNPNFVYDLEIGRMYGELGDFGNMFSSYLDYMLKKPNYTGLIKRRMDEFITEDPENETNVIFRKTLLKKNQTEPDILYNELLSWLFVQEKQFRKAFLQEKAIYKKTDDGIPQLINLAYTTRKEKAYDVSEEILNFVIDNTEIESFKVNAHRAIMQIKTETSTPSNYAGINKKYLQLIELYGNGRFNMGILLDYARFLGFKQDKKNEAISFLKKLLKRKLPNIEKAETEILLADVLVLSNKFNQALIYYTKAEKRVKGDLLAQEARFKIAKASYYKGDFDWAKTQLNVLKASTTQLIANDAMQLALTIDDNTKEDDSTAIAALKLFAKGELLTFQEQHKKAITTYQQIIDNFKGNEIEDETLFNQAMLYLKMEMPEKAIVNFEKIIQFFPTSLLIDDTYFALGNLYTEQEKTMEAKNLFEKIIFDHADSIYYVDARKKYRKLRGDAIVN
ncbi:tetratricopeptide repeat protein [Aquimarina agarivorans]|uniref:tetratricopeptide repeat protein n=1 Tax=Aquimarina agarivorans TaxID=980584 RepID=UPI000248E917|nr:tetratricopeptide repeat protein [Aquimarina agarivorans]